MEGGIIALILGAAIVGVCARSVLITSGSVRIAMATALLAWMITSLVATVEENRSTWLLVSVIALAARLAAAHPETAKQSFPRGAEESA